MKRTRGQARHIIACIEGRVVPSLGECMSENSYRNFSDGGAAPIVCAHVRAVAVCVCVWCMPCALRMPRANHGANVIRHRLIDPERRRAARQEESRGSVRGKGEPVREESGSERERLPTM